jgi:hypothetical protein
MNKKAALGMEIFVFLIATAIIATAFFLFYLYYGYSAKGIDFKIDDKTADFNENHVLISLLETPVGNGLTIADQIVTNNPDAIQRIGNILGTTYGPKLKYVLTFDGNLVAKTSEQPDSPITQEVLVPVPFKKPAKIIMEFGI